MIIVDCYFSSLTTDIEMLENLLFTIGMDFIFVDFIDV